MPKQYLDRIIAIREMLASPLKYTVLEGLDLLVELFQENAQNPEFTNELNVVINDFPAVKPKILDMIIKSHEMENKDLPGGHLEKVENLEKMKSHTAKIFISYSHTDEKHMKRLTSMLKPFEQQKIFEMWHDREITAGDEWYQDIQNAINSCNIALLLVSIDFLNSRFIQEEELPPLLQLRKERGLRIVPIIIRDCPWTSVPILKDLQALPKDGKPVISFKGTNQPDRIWAEIAMRIAELSKGI